MYLPVSVTRACSRAPSARCPRSLRHVLPSCSSRRSMAHASPLPIPPMPGESCEAISPYPFKPYNLTPFDVSPQSPHHFTSLQFFLPPDQLPHALNRLEGAVLRLISHYPFLTGNVISPSSGPGGNATRNVFEIQPVTASIMQHIPMLQTQHHPESSVFSPSGHLTHTFLPFPVIPLPTDSTPALRCKANVLGTKLLLVFGWDTRVMDPGAVFAVARALAEFCRDPTAAREELPVSDPLCEAQGRERGEWGGDVLSGLGLSSTEHARHWYPGPRSCVDMGSAEDVSTMPETCTARLNGDKIAMLTDACNLLVGRVAHDSFPGRLGQEDVVSAALGVCGSRARNHRVCSYPRSAAAHADEETISVATDLRHVSPLLSSATYMGNATMSIPVPAQLNSLAAVGDSHLRSLLPEIPPQDLYRICNFAVNLRRRRSALEKGCELSISWKEIAETSLGNIMQIHSLRPMDFYMDFGPLGRVRDVTAPGTRENGTCWVLPEREERDGWDVAVTVERKAMENLRADRLVKWVADGGFS